MECMHLTTCDSYFCGYKVWCRYSFLFQLFASFVHIAVGFEMGACNGHAKWLKKKLYKHTLHVSMKSKRQTEEFFIPCWLCCYNDCKLCCIFLFEFEKNSVGFSFYWIGLSAEELERLATLGTKAQKTARRDIAYVVSAFGIIMELIYACICRFECPFISLD
jgi:hypothetical protein